LHGDPTYNPNLTLEGAAFSLGSFVVSSAGRRTAAGAVEKAL
jgi:hypothetical protein